MIFLHDRDNGRVIIIEYTVLVEFTNTPPIFFIGQREIIDVGTF